VQGCLIHERATQTGGVAFLGERQAIKPGRLALIELPCHADFIDGHAASFLFPAWDDLLFTMSEQSISGKSGEESARKW